MNTSPLRAAYGVIFALAMLSLASPSSAQQRTAPAPSQAPALSQPQPSAIPAPAAQPAQAPAPSAVVPSASAPAASDATATPADGGSRSLKSTAPALRELSPWSMFLSADVLVKAVMIGLAFASLVTWTIFLAKTIELFIARRPMRAALQGIEPAASLPQAHSLLDGQQSILAEFLAAAARQI